MARNGATYAYKNLKCVGCGVVFNSKARNKKQKYCTKKCGAIHTASNGRIKKGGVPWNKGLIGYNKGYPRSKEWCDKISKANSGKNAPNWRGGISAENERIRKTREYIVWRRAVFDRDDYTCQLCGARSEKGHRVYLHADHIKPFAVFVADRFSIPNGRTLCAPCHRQTPTYGVSLKQ